MSSQVVGHQGARVEIEQRPTFAVNGWIGVAVLAADIAWGLLDSELVWLKTVIFILVVISLVVVSPGETYVVQFFGTYIGTVSKPGFWWIVPLTIRRKVSVRVCNFETNHLKVNDADGS